MVATDKQYRVVGQRPVRPDGIDKVTGRAEYGGDIRLPGMLYGRVKRAPHAHAIIKRIDTSRAAALPGVMAVITNADFPRQQDGVINLGEGSANPRWLLDNVLASDKVLYRGHAVAAVCATDPHIAEDALDLIDVEYEVLEPVLDVQDAMQPSAPVLHDNLVTEEVAGLFGGGGTQSGDRPSNVAKHILFRKGDAEAAFASADVVVEREFTTSMYHQGYIEPHNGTAVWNADGQLTVWLSTQGSFPVRDQLSLLLQLPVSRIKVVPLEIGGGFGGKIPVYMEPMAAVMARKTGRPVKMIMTRQEVFEATGPTSGSHSRVKIGARRDGTIVAAEGHFALEAGAYPGSPFAAAAMCALAPYTLEHAMVEAWDVVVNKPKVAAYRAPGAPGAVFAVESVLDEIAEQLEIDPIDLRLRNAAVDGTRRVDGAEFGVIGNVDVMEAARESEHYRSELTGEHVGRGISMGFWFNVGMESSAYGIVNADGTCMLVLGSTDIGGSRASLAQQFAETLGIPYESVKPQVVDTDSVGFTMVTGGSRTTFAGGWAVYETALDIRRQMEARAARIWECDPSAVTYGDDGVIRGPEGKEFTFVELAGKLAHTGGMIEGRADVSPDTAGPAFACHIADVRVDPETGKVDVLRYTAIQDVGTAIHPSYVEGQIQGGAAQGIGMALSEEYVFDPTGRMVNSTLLDYRMATALDLPMLETVLVEKPNPGHPYGVRGVGEVPIVPPLAAIANAIADATGVRPRNLPASPGRLLDQLMERDA